MKRMTFALALVAAPAAAAPHPAPAGEVRIPFPDKGGIVRMQADGDEALWVQDRHYAWYRAELYGPCYGLSRALGIGYDTHGGDFDRYTTILAGGERCQIRSLAPSDPPPPKRRRR